MMKLLIIE